MRKITLLLAALCMTVSVTMAQGGRRGQQGTPDPKVRAERMTERMVKEYDLNEKQKGQLYELNLERAEKMDAKRVANVDKNKQKSTCCNCCGGCKVASKGKRGGSRGGMQPKLSAEEREKRMTEMKQANEEYDAKVKGIFTKKQYEAYGKKQADRQQRMGASCPLNKE